MFWEDLRKTLLGPALYRLDGMIAIRLVPVFYALGLGAIFLWAVDHLVNSFASNFAQGLWGILEIVVYAPLALVTLRIVTEAVLLFFRAHEALSASVGRGRSTVSLADEVRDAIHELAEDNEAASATDVTPS
jgi:hypothetical protein